MATSKKATKPARKKRVAKKKVSKKKVARKTPAKKGAIRDHMKLLESWTEFVKVPITSLSVTQLDEMLEREKAGAQRWSFINRLHGALNAKRVKAERDELRRKFQ